MTTETQEPRIKRVECDICEKIFTDGTVVEIAQSIARHWNNDHGDELGHDMQPFKTEEYGGRHLHGDEYAYRVKEYYVTSYDVLDTTGPTCGPFAYAFVKKPEGAEFCDDCGRSIQNVDGYREVDDSGWQTKYRCDECSEQRKIKRRAEENQDLGEFA